MSVQALTEQEIAVASQAAPLWRREGIEIKRVFLFQSFMDSIGFVNQIAAYAEQANHHPDILVQYNKVQLLLSTHDAGGLSQKDFDFAKVADGIFHQC